MTLTKRVFRAGVGTIATKLLNAALTFLLLVLLSRALGAQGYGIYAFAIAVTSLVGISARFGIPPLVVRETANLETTRAWSSLKALWIWAAHRVLIVSAVVILLALCSLPWWKQWVPEGGYIPLAIALVLVPIEALGLVRGGALRGLRHVVVGQIPEKIIAPILLLFCASIVYFSGTPLTPVRVIVLQACAGVVAFAVGALLLHRMMPREIHEAIPIRVGSELLKWKRSALPLGISGGADIINKNAGLVVLGLLSTAEDSGVYKVVIGTSLFAMFGVQAATTFALPYFSRFHALKDTRRLIRLGVLTSRLIFALTAVITLALIIFGRPLIALAFGHEFAGAYEPLVIILLAQIPVASLAAAPSLLNMTGHEMDPMRVLSIAAVGNVALCLTLVPFLNVQGAAIAYSLSSLASSLALAYMCRTRIGFVPFALRKSL